MPSTTIYDYQTRVPFPKSGRRPGRSAENLAARKRANLKVVGKRAAPLPEGYAFVPPATGLDFPATYHLIDAGPQHAKAAPKRGVLRALVNAVGRVVPGA